MSLSIQFTPQQLDKLKSAAKSATEKEIINEKADAISEAIKMVGDVASGIISTIGAIKNAKLRKQLEEQLQYIDEQQASELENSLRAINNENGRIAKMMDLLSKMVGQQSANKILSKKLSGSVSDRKKIVYIFGGIVILLIGVLVIKKIKK